MNSLYFERVSSSKIVLAGGGGHCKSVIDIIKRQSKYDEIVITDSVLPKGSVINGYKVVGTDEQLPELYNNGYRKCFITVGSIMSTAIRRKIFNNVRKLDFCFPTVVDSSADISSSSIIGNGVFIGKKAIVNVDVIIEDMSIINTGAIIEHECRIGRFSHIAVGAVICGNVEVGQDVFIGANSTVVQGVKIGMRSIIGAGSLILADVPADTKIVGVWGGNDLNYRE